MGEKLSLAKVSVAEVVALLGRRENGESCAIITWMGPSRRRSDAYFWLRGDDAFFTHDDKKIPRLLTGEECKNYIYEIEFQI